MKNGFVFNKVADGEAEILMYDLIGMDFWTGEGITAKQFSKDLKALGDVKSIHVKINSPGGDYFDGVAIANELKDHPATVKATVMSLAASVASVILMSADEIVMQENAQIMIHKAWSFAMGNGNDFAKVADTLNKLDDGLVLTYQSRTKQPAAKIEEWMSAETWFSAKDAVELGFADSIIAAKEKVANKFALLKTYRHTPADLAEPPAEDPAIEIMQRRLALLRQAVA